MIVSRLTGVQTPAASLTHQLQGVSPQDPGTTEGGSAQLCVSSGAAGAEWEEQYGQGQVGATGETGEALPCARSDRERTQAGCKSWEAGPVQRLPRLMLLMTLCQAPGG